MVKINHNHSGHLDDEIDILHEYPCYPAALDLSGIREHVYASQDYPNLICVQIELSMLISGY